MVAPTPPPPLVTRGCWSDVTTEQVVWETGDTAAAERSTT